MPVFVCCLANIASCACVCHLASIVSCACACIVSASSSLWWPYTTSTDFPAPSMLQWCQLFLSVPPRKRSEIACACMWMCVSKKLLFLENMFCLHQCKRQGMKELWFWWFGLLLSSSFSTIKVYVRRALCSALMLQTEDRGWERLKTRVFVLNG